MKNRKWHRSGPWLGRLAAVTILVLSSEFAATCCSLSGSLELITRIGDTDDDTPIIQRAGSGGAFGNALHRAGGGRRWAPVAAQEPAIPELAWEQRSDWINVKTAVAPPAKGDGTTDDTTAIQAALNKIEDGATIYFPPGTYRITATLLIPQGRFLGVSLLGHGRTSVLAWDGPAGGRMYWTQDGMPYCRYIGLTWDGRDKAAVGIDHSNLKIFETEIRHEHEAFVRFTEAGVRIGHQQQVATAETNFRNCLFDHCGHGASLRNFNDLDLTFEGCEFRHCGVGVYSGKGTNCYVRNCHFEQNGELDVFSAGEQGSSVRRCTSHGSKQFLKSGSSVGPMVVQDCQVDAWTHPGSAVQIGGAATLLFDCTFTHPPSAEAPIEITYAQQRLVYSGNQAPQNVPLLKKPESAVAIEVPAGTRSGTLKSAQRSFLKSQVKVPGKVFDAKRDFGAKGDGGTDDTAAIRQILAAARAHGQGAIAYLPPGRYVVTDTIELTGSDYTFGGSGFRTGLVWKGPAGATMLEVRDPQRLTLENISAGHHDTGVGDNAIDIRQTGSAGGSSITYDRVWVSGMYQKKPLERGIRFANLGPRDRVHVRELNGNIHFTDCARATVLLDLSYEGTILIQGKFAERDGFLGACVRLGTVTDPALWVQDNHSFVASDFYVESSDHLLRMQGDASLPAGRVTLQGAKFELVKPENNGLEVDNYRGELILGPDQFYVGNPVHRFVHEGSAPFSLTLLAGTFYNSKPEFKLAPSATLSVIGIYTVGTAPGDSVAASDLGVMDRDVAPGLPHVVHALDDLRRLGGLDLEVNHPE